MSRPFYSESDSWPWWTWAIFVGAMMVAAWAVVGDSQGGGAGPMGLSFGETATALGLATGLPVLFWAVFGKLTLEVYPREIRARFGSLGWIQKTVPLDRVLQVEGVRYRPMIEFGGWGIRTRPGKRAWTVRGSEAVRLTFQEGPSLYLGTPNPQRLKERIDLALDRLVAAGSTGPLSPEGEKE